MSHSRNLLHKSRLAEFRAWLEGGGWVLDAKPNADYQVLRMRHPHHPEMLIVYESNHSTREHLTTFGKSERMARLFANRLKPSATSRPGAGAEDSNRPATEVN